MTIIRSLAVLVCFGLTAAAAQTVYYLAEKAPLPPFTVAVENVKYSYGTQVNKPGQGFLFLYVTATVRNLGSQEAAFRWPDCLSIHSGTAVYAIDTTINAAVRSAGKLKPQEEKRVNLTFKVPKQVYDGGALAHLASGNERAVVDLRYVDRFEGHLSAGLALADSSQHGRALAEFQKAQDGMQEEDKENRTYLFYSMAESYSKLFMYEEAIEKFKTIAGQDSSVKFYTESRKNLTALEQRLQAEDRKQKAVRLVEAGYNYVTQLGNNPKALELFTTIRREYAGIPMGEFTTEQVAALYSAMAHMNMLNYKAALDLCQAELKEPRTARAPEYQKTLNETIKQCQDLMKKAK